MAAGSSRSARKVEEAKDLYDIFDRKNLLHIHQFASTASSGAHRAKSYNETMF